MNLRETDTSVGQDLDGQETNWNVMNLYLNMHTRSNSLSGLIREKNQSGQLGSSVKS